MVARERRRSQRVTLAKAAHGRLRSSVPVSVIDLSSEGMQIEVATSLRPGSLYEVSAEVEGIPLAALIRITRCKAGGYVPDGRGGNLLVFRAGAELVRLDGDAVEFRRWVHARTSAGAAAAANMSPK